MGELLSLLQDFDVANFLPKPEKFLNSLEGWVRLLVLAAPLVLLGLGLWYRYVSPQKPGGRLGFPLWVSVGSMKAWHYAQKLCNMAYLGLGGGLTVLMLFVSLFFNGQRGLGMIHTALVCVVIEFVLILAAWIGINVLVGRAYDKEGRLKRRP